MDWRSTNETPDWREGGNVEVKDKEGHILKGWLALDAAFDGEDEYPVTILEIDGKEVSFYDFDEWRQVAE